MKSLVVSHTHHLLPLAWRLHQEGWEVDVIIDRDRYERAWKGKFDKKLRKTDKRSRAQIDLLRQQAEADEAAVVTDSPRWNEAFAGYPRLFGYIERPPEANRLPFLQIGAWFDGEEFSFKHILIEDQGLWPGGLGPDHPGALTLIMPKVWPEVFHIALDRVKDELKTQSYHGLVRIGVSFNPEDQEDPSIIGYQAGWNFLQMHALLAEAGDLGSPQISDILLGAAPAFCHRFTMVMPVSIPPYPYKGVEGVQHLIPKQAVKCNQVFWHDMLVEDGVCKTAGLDGLVGVVRASADNFMLARGRTLALAKLFDFPELQIRPDAGALVDRVLADFEADGFLI